MGIEDGFRSVETRSGEDCFVAALRVMTKFWLSFLMAPHYGFLVVQFFISIWFVGS
jgi:hypothetical protein